MISKFLISALILSTPVSAMAQAELAAGVQVFTTAKAKLVSSVYQSKKAVKVKKRMFDYSVTDESEVDAFYRVTFLKAGVKDQDYEFDGRGNLDYEVLIETIEVATGKFASRDSTFYAKSTGKKSLSIYDCDSTRNCSADLGVTKAFLVESGSEQALKILSSKDALGVFGAEDIILVKTK